MSFFGGFDGDFFICILAGPTGGSGFSGTPCTTGLGLNFLDRFCKDFAEMLERFLLADCVGV